jgi:cytochrome c-type biogenesis protein CcmF
MVIWLWIGGGLMALGTAFAAFPGRRRNPLDPVSSSPATVERGGPHDVTGTDRDPVEVA